MRFVGGDAPPQVTMFCGTVILDRKYDGGRSREAVTERQPNMQRQLGQAAIQIFAANDRMNQILIEGLDPAVWKPQPPGKVRSIVAIFTHMHNVRTKWVRLTAPHMKVPRAIEACALHAAAGTRRIGGERRSMHRDAGGGARRRGPCKGVSQRRMGEALAGWLGNAVLHGCSRSPPPRTGMHTCASVRVSLAGQGDIGDLELGKAMGRVWLTRPGFVRNHRETVWREAAGKSRFLDCAGRSANGQSRSARNDNTF